MDENRKLKIKKLGILLLIHGGIIPLSVILISIILPGSFITFLCAVLFAFAWIYFVAGRIAKKIVAEKQQANPEK
jgi:hypothetical protein